MNRPNPFGPHHRRDDREPMLMDISTAKPSGEVNWEAIIAKTQRGKADGSRKTYDTSAYLERVREEDPWPEEAVAKECAVRIVSCRLLDPAPIDLCKPVRVACEVERTGPLDATESLQISLVTIHREKGCDAEEPCGDSLDVKLEARASQLVNVVFKLDKKQVIGGREPGVQIYLRA